MRAGGFRFAGITAVGGQGWRRSSSRIGTGCSDPGLIDAWVTQLSRAIASTPLDTGAELAEIGSRPRTGAGSKYSARRVTGSFGSRSSAGAVRLMEEAEEFCFPGRSAASTCVRDVAHGRFMIPALKASKRATHSPVEGDLGRPRRRFRDMYACHYSACPKVISCRRRHRGVPDGSRPGRGSTGFGANRIFVII